MMATEVETIASLEAKVAALEKSSWSTKKNDDESAITPDLCRARRHVQESHCYSSTWKHCPPNYYELGLDKRKVILGAHSTSQLCKACLFENKHYVPNNENGGKKNNKKKKKNSDDPSNSQYYLIVVQYVESINTKRLASELRGLRPAGPTRFDPNYFSDLRLAPEEISEQLTGYGHNGVSPFGMLQQMSIPVVICKSITNARPAFVWMGGGHKDWKLGMAVSEFVKGVDGIVLDVSEPRV